MFLSLPFHQEFYFIIKNFIIFFRVIDKIEEDKELTRVLDRLVLYLRVVHSVDYYSCTEYPNEDEMPHR